MAYEVRIDKATRTIEVTGTGNGTTADTLALIAGQHEAFRANPGFNLLYDASKLQIDSSSADIMKVAAALLDQSGATFGRIAVVVPQSREEVARVFAALAHPHGISANVFTHLADARNWLGIADDR